MELIWDNAVLQSISTHMYIHICIYIMWCLYNSNFLQNAYNRHPIAPHQSLIFVLLRYIIPWHDDVIKWKHFPRYWPFVWGFTGHQWIPHTKPSDMELWCFFFDLHLNKRLSKHSWGWWFETPSCSLWRHCDDYWIKYKSTQLYYVFKWAEPRHANSLQNLTIPIQYINHDVRGTL